VTLIEYRSGLISLLSPDARSAFHRTVLRLLSAPFLIGARSHLLNTSWREPDRTRPTDRRSTDSLAVSRAEE
jgi:hypothetical protein